MGIHVVGSVLAVVFRHDDERIGRIGAVGYRFDQSSDGEIVEGVASVNESAITGESAPVIREAGGDLFRKAVEQRWLPALESFRPLLDGTTNWPAVLDAFEKINYKGYLTFEYFHPYLHWPEALVYQTADSLDRMLGIK